ncbi:hypothetical protein GCM10022419_032170 [Nonomuraea rosea]|uniref:Uncharacterized protein n=1 Tax=Nonomuraea rosea TaxID=638574 RepID=A0ABP6WEU9_9ACTN
MAGTLSPGHLAVARIKPAGTRGLGLWLVRRPCDEAELDHPGGGARLGLRMRSAVARRQAVRPGDRR